MRHKLTTFILKNPPKKASKKSKKRAVAGADAIEGQPGQVDDEEGGSDDELTKKIEAGAAEVMTEEEAARLIAQRENDEDWSVDTSKEAVAARISKLDAKLQSSLLLGDDDDEEGGETSYDVFGQWVRENKGSVTDVEIYKKAEEDGLEKKYKTLIPLFQALFEDVKIADELESHLALFAKLTTSEKHQKALLGGLERLLAETSPDQIPTLPKILMELYQADILEEELLQSWGTHVSKK
jgi:translation initiation factor 5